MMRFCRDLFAYVTKNKTYILRKTHCAKLIGWNKKIEFIKSSKQKKKRILNLGGFFEDFHEVHHACCSVS